MKIPAELHERLFTGSLYAGMVLNECSTAFPHPLGYPLTERFAVPHGQACALFLPALLERGETFQPGRTRMIYRFAGLTRQGFAELLSALKHLPIIHLDSSLLEDCRARWRDVKNFKNSPGGFTAEEALSLFEKTFAL